MSTWSAQAIFQHSRLHDQRINVTYLQKEFEKSTAISFGVWLHSTSIRTFRPMSPESDSTSTSDQIQWKQKENSLHLLVSVICDGYDLLTLSILISLIANTTHYGNVSKTVAVMRQNVRIKKWKRSKNWLNRPVRMHWISFVANMPKIRINAKNWVQCPKCHQNRAENRDLNIYDQYHWQWQKFSTHFPKFPPEPDKFVLPVTIRTHTQRARE